MKKIIFSFILLLTLSFLPRVSLAQNIATNSAPMNVDYTLPYPGLLPDNPLYYLKAIRDNIQKFLIFDPLKKSQFDLLQADKRLAAANTLLAKDENNLAITTLSKSGNYFDDAITNIEKAKRQGEDVSATISNLILASEKHQEIIFKMQKGKKGDLLLNLKFFQERALDFEQRVEIIQSI